MTEIKNYINGKFSGAKSGKTLENIDPSTGEVYSHLPDSDHEDVNDAVRAANAAFQKWSNTPARERAALMTKIADKIDEQLEELALAESRDNGKPVQLARTVDIPRASLNMRFFASGIQHFASESHYMEEGLLSYTMRRPGGVAGCISPWNLPLYLFTWKIAPALAAGCTVVAKPSELTPLTAYLFTRICKEAELPDGVLNVVHGLGSKVGQSIVEHKEVPILSFTGGTATGKKIMTTAGPMFKKISLELGGKNPNIIFDDADLDLAIQTSVRSSFANQGQICLCGSRIFVQEKVYDTFVEKFVQSVQKLKPGNPLEAHTKVGALVSKAHLEKVLGYVQLAQEEGGKVVAGGNQIKLDGPLANGFYMEPTVITGLSASCRTNTEEIFGPVVTIVPFKNEEEVIKFANGTPYGLSATLWTENLKRAHGVAHQLKSGIVWINCWLLRDLRTPFGGMKQSGVGREGGWEALRFFTEPQNVSIQL